MQKYLYWVLIIFLAVGIYYPIIGVIALGCMLAPVAMSLFSGRKWCGVFCPRGSFYDNVLAKFAAKRPVPEFFSSVYFRAFIISTVMAIFLLQIEDVWGDLEQVGFVFIRLIIVTTLVGVVLGVVYNERGWCTFCPMGSISAAITTKKAKRIFVSNTCVGCRLCQRTCPMRLYPGSAKGAKEGFADSDCIRCGRCIQICPRKSLRFQVLDSK